MKYDLAILVFLGAYVLIATEWVHRVVVALAGAWILLLAGVVDAHDVFFSEETGVDWNVIFLLFGMMVIVGVLRHTGLFEYLAIWAAKRARGRPFRVMVLLTLITAVASALLDNVTTILLVAPVTLLIADRLGFSPVPFLVAEVLASNIGGTATLIGDPPNIIIASEADLTYTDFLLNLAPIVVVLLAVFMLFCRRYVRGMRSDDAHVAAVMALNEREALVPGPLLVQALAVLAIVTVAFALQTVLGLEPSVVALLGAGALLLLARGDHAAYLREVELPTLAFFMGLFVMVGALVKVGAIEDLAEIVIELTGGDLFVATVMILIVSAFLSAVVDNIPYVATMAPIVAALVASFPEDATVLWWALALGADLGGNATSIGASANVVALGVSERAGRRIRFAEFLRYGLPVTAVTVAISLPYLWVRYFLLA